MNYNCILKQIIKKEIYVKKQWRDMYIEEWNRIKNLDIDQHNEVHMHSKVNNNRRNIYKTKHKNT